MGLYLWWELCKYSEVLEMAICSTFASSYVRKAKTAVCDAITANLILARVASVGTPASRQAEVEPPPPTTSTQVLRNTKIRVKISKL